MNPRRNWSNRIDLDDTRDVAARVRFDEADSLIGRLGLRLAKDWPRGSGGVERHTSVWLRPSVWHNFKGEPVTGFSSETGFVPFEADIGGNCGEINLGIDHWIDHSTTLYFSAGYREAFDGDSDSDSYDVMFGLKGAF